MTINLPADLAGFVNELVVSGRFASDNAAIVEGLRLLRQMEQRREELRAEIRKGDEGPGIPYQDVLRELDDLTAQRTSKLS